MLGSLSFPGRGSVHEDDNEHVGAYYMDVEDEEFETVLKYEYYKAHPDFLLRSLGIIRQRGKYALQHVPEVRVLPENSLTFFFLLLCST